MVVMMMDYGTVWVVHIYIEGLFSKNGTVSLGDRFCCENNALSVLKRKGKGDLYGERNGTVASQQALRIIDGESFYATEWNSLSRDTKFVLSGDEDDD